MTPGHPDDVDAFDDFEDDAPTDPLIRAESAQVDATAPSPETVTAAPVHDDFEDEATVVMMAELFLGDGDNELADAATVVVPPQEIVPKEALSDVRESLGLAPRASAPPRQVPDPIPARHRHGTDPLPLTPGPAPEPGSEPETYETRRPFEPDPEPPAPKPRRKPSMPLLHRIVYGTLGLVGLCLTLIVGGTLAAGSGYYGAPHMLRLENPLHSALRPGGPIGLVFGLLGTTLMVGMLVYSIRKALLKVQWLGPMPLWLAFHITCGVFGPLLIILHAGLAMPTGLIAVGFWSMIIVALSGIFGRYVYGHFPKSASGKSSGLREARETLTDLRAELVELTPGPAGVQVGEAVLLARDLDVEARSLVGLVRLDLEVRRRARRIRRVLNSASLAPTIRRTATETLMSQLKLKRSVETYEVAARWLRLWHLFHLPLAQAMYLIVALHVAEAFIFGGAFKTLRVLVGG